MKIIFINIQKELEYIEAYSIENDFKNGYTRPSIEVHMSIGQTSYNEIESILNNNEAIKSFMLIGDPFINADGELIETPISIYEDYTIKGKISVEDDIITFKLYRLSDVEIENRDAMSTIDSLLIAMEG